MPQTEYGLGYALIALCLILGMLVICVPRPRRATLLVDKKKKKRRKKKR